MFSGSLLALSVLFLLGTFFLTFLTSALRKVYKHDAKKQLQSLGNTFFYRKFHLFFFPEHEYEGVFFAAISAQNITRFCATVSMVFFLLFEFNIVPTSVIDGLTAPSWGLFFTALFAFLVLAFLITDFLPRTLGARYPQIALKISAPIASLFMFLVFPLTFLYLKFSQLIFKSAYFDLSHETIAEVQQEILEILQNTDRFKNMDSHDKKLLESVMEFKERFAREVMVPRVDMFSLAANMPIREAARLLETEGYSRIPIYTNNVDNIQGVLMSKDLLAKYREYEEKGNDPKILDAPIETIQKPVLHIPETKKLSSLLLEFRKKHMHLAIIVDEYGGTEGIITIEDILEVIVGDIGDEYDEADQLYFQQSDGTWIVDARMNILDVDEELGIQIPQDGEYDTIGGYIFHTAGTIPTKGFVIHHDDFEMEIIQSNDRSVEKVRIKTIPKDTMDH